MEGEIQLNAVNEINEGPTETCSWIMEIREGLSNMESIPGRRQGMERRNSIHKLPAAIRRNFNSDDYEPYIVSFGPYHHGHDSCRQTEQIKKDVVIYTLRRTNRTIDSYIEALRADVQDLKDAYVELDSRWQQEDDEFLRMMIYDGCFLLDILQTKDNPLVWNVDGIRLEELRKRYTHDVLLLENQIPMVVLQRLAAVQGNKSFQIAEAFLRRSIPLCISPRNTTLPRSRDTHFHILDLCRDSLLSEKVRPKRALEAWVSRFLGGSETPLTTWVSRFLGGSETPLTTWVSRFLGGSETALTSWVSRFLGGSEPTYLHINIPSAAELERVGIRFTTSRTNSLQDIAFENRTLRLPQISVDGTTRSMFLNIIALEQHRYPNEVSSYIYFMSRLLQSAEDVRILQRCGIIYGSLLVNEVVDMFNGLITDILHDPRDFLVIQYHNLAGKLNRSFHERMNNSLQNDLWQKYLRSPVGRFSLAAAFFFYALTVVQTLYTVLGYYNKK